MAHTNESGIVVRRSAAFRYGAAVLAVVAAAAVRLALEPVLGVYAPYLPFTLAVIVASLFGGRGPGLAAAGLSLAAADYFFLEPRYAFEVSAAALPGLALFAVVATIISFLIGRLRESLISSAEKSAQLEELNTALEMAHVMVRKPDGVITNWSRGAAAMFGFPPEEAVGLRSHDLLKTEFPESLEKIQERLMERGTWEGELRHHRRDGSAVLAASHWSLQRNQQGRPSAVVETNNDITALRQAEEAVRESEERLRLAQQVAGVGTFEWNIQTGVNRWTPELEAMYGLPPGGFAGTEQAWEALVHPADRAEAVRRVERAMDTGNFEAEWRVIQPNGELRWLFGRAWMFKDDSGKPLRLVGVNVDITERKRAEETLQQKTALINFSHDAVISADKDRVITTWNKGAEEIYGWTETEAVGKVMHQLFHTGSPVSTAEIDRILARDGRWDGELVHTRRDGKQITVESRQVLRRDAAGVPTGILEINRDISERRRLEDQFRQAQKLEGIGRLAGGVAHDFNNMLTVISGYAETVLDDLAKHHPSRGAVEQISKAASRATSLTRQLLIFSRRQVSEPRNFVLNDLVRDFEKMLQRLIGEDIDLVLSLAPDAGVLRADAGQIEQVLLNLAVNARDAMPKGGTLSVETSSLLADEEFASTHLSVQPGLYVVLAVSDTGVGMSPEVKSHLFEPFFTTKEAGKGTGLGLSTVYGIVKQSRGSIWVYSEPGRGTTFRMLFPAVEAEGEPAPPAPVEAPSGSETILLAEDEPGVRGFVRQTLERHGYKVLEASNGREALELARKYTGPLHLVMADVVMPEMGGAELAAQFGAEHPGVPVIFMSGYANHVGLREEMGAGYLQKPFTSASLLTQVRAVLDAV